MPTPAAAAPPADVVPQHLVLMLPSTGEFDSRTYRIATTCIARGHTVTVVARHKPGLPWREEHPAGFTLIRVARHDRGRDAAAAARPGGAGAGSAARVDRHAPAVRAARERRAR